MDVGCATGRSLTGKAGRAQPPPKAQREQGLITGADRDGRLTLPTPQRGHALLFTTDVPEGKRISEAGNVLSPAQAATATSRTVRGVGMVTLADGRQRYFRTVPFDPSPLWSSRSRPQGVIQGHVPPRSFEEEPFGSRRVIVAGPASAWKVKEKVLLAHIHAMPLGGGLRESVYLDDVLAEVLRGPEEGARLVEWAEPPKGSKASKGKKWLSSWSSRSKDRGAAGAGSSSPSQDLSQ